jgi:DNA-binding GntR family transcriptional regulator
VSPVYDPRMSGVADKSLGQAHLPLRSVVYEELRRLILAGELPPGSRLVEDHLATRLGVSRNPVREAIRVLAAEGFIEVLPRRGATVASMGVAEVEELFDVRVALESLGARLAARHVTPEVVDRLLGVLADAERATADGLQSELVDLNAEFHEAVIEAAGNTYLAMVAQPVLHRARWVYQQSLHVRAAHSWTEHISLARAIIAGDEVAAEAYAVAHVSAARASFRAAR